MKTGLNKREKIMILLCALVLISYVAVQYVILPVYQSYNEKTDTRDLLVYEKAQLSLKLQSEQLYQDSFNKINESYLDVKSRYHKYVPNEDVDRMLTGLCLQNKLIPSTLGISPTFAYGGQDAQSSAFSVVTATMTLSGTYDSLKNLINAVEKIDYIRICSTSIDFTVAQNTEESDTTVSTSPNITVFFEVTMLNEIG